jgi:transcriptional regulator with XRE-family HTH domain
MWRSRLFLREHLQRRQISQAKLAELAGKSTAEISLIMRGLSAGSPETLENIADALGLDHVGKLFERPK